MNNTPEKYYAVERESEYGGVEYLYDIDDGCYLWGSYAFGGSCIIGDNQDTVEDRYLNACSLARANDGFVIEVFVTIGKRI